MQEPQRLDNRSEGSKITVWEVTRVIYTDVTEGRFVSRPNRFIAHVDIDGRREVCHVKNTGQCRELLVPDARVWLQKNDSPTRRTKYDLIAVQKGELLINMDSQAPNRVFGEYLEAGGIFGRPDLIRPETVFGSSRFDFYVEAGQRRAFCEVKGVTLEENGVARFPDAPTERGRKHLRELIRCVEAGFEAWAVFVAQMSGMRYFEPNAVTDPDFAAALSEAVAAGVNLLVLECRVTPESLEIAGEIPARVK